MHAIEDLVDGELNLAMPCAPRVFRKVAQPHRANHFETGRWSRYRNSIPRCPLHNAHQLFDITEIWLMSTL